MPLESSPPTYVTGLPANYQTPEELAAYGKPLLHRSLQETAARSFGVVPFTGPEAISKWSDFMNTYLLLQSYVDIQIGAVLTTLASKPQVQANTIVVFTSDHGEYGGAHGMRGKGAAAYEEAIRVPLYVYDPRGIATAAVGTPRNQLTSSVDVIGLLLSLATGSNAWRRERALSHLAKRQDLAAICASPSAPGRPWVLHATDEDVTEFATEPHDAEAPRHVIALRGAAGKFAIYANWAPGTMNIQTAGQETEFYNYASPDGHGRAGQRSRLRRRAQGTPADDAARTGDFRPSSGRRCRLACTQPSGPASKTTWPSSRSRPRRSKNRVSRPRPRPNRRPADARPPALPSPAPPVSSGGAGGGAAAYRASGH